MKPDCLISDNLSDLLISSKGEVDRVIQFLRLILEKVL